MSESVLNANVRNLIGSAKAKQLRQNNVLPAILYGNNMESQALELNLFEVIKYFSSNNIGSSVYLNIGGEKVFAIVKDLQRNIMTREPIHVDFQALTMGEKIKIKVPFIYNGKDSLKEGWILQTLMDSIEIQTLPKYLIDKVEIDLSNADLGDIVTVADLPLIENENIEILADKTQPIYSITEATRFAEAEDTEDEEEEPTTMPM